MTLATRLRENKAVYVGAGAVDLAVEKIREVPETVTKLRETVNKYQDEVQKNVTKIQDDVRENMTKYQDEVRKNVTRLQDEVRENVSKLEERVDAKDIPGAAVAYATHFGTRAVEVVDELAERGKKIVNRVEDQVATKELAESAKRTTVRTRAAAGEAKKTVQAARKATGAAAKKVGD